MTLNVYLTLSVGKYTMCSVVNVITTLTKLSDKKTKGKIMTIQILNLDPTFAPLGASTTLDSSRPFPSGIESNIQLTGVVAHQPATITIRFDSGQANMMKLLLATDALRRMSVNEIHLFVSFLPYARQDRIEPEWIGQSFALKVFAEVINTQKYASVRMFDPHSTVATAVIDRSVAVLSDAFLREVFRDKNSFVLVSPDAGAAKKIRHASAVIGYTKKPVQALKYRLVGGAIDQVEIYESDLGGKDAYIIDDICDGGATFIALASELRKRNVGKVILVVSHGIFSRGMQVLLDAGIDHIYTTDSFKEQVQSDKLTEVKLCNILI